MQYLHFAGELTKGEKYILTGIIIAFLLGGFGDSPLLGLLIMVIGAIILIKNNGLTILLDTPLTRPLILLLFISLISLIRITNWYSATSMLGTVLEIIFSFFTSYYVFSNKTEKFHSKMIIILFAGGVIAGLIGIYEYFILHSRRLHLLTNPNLLGVYMLFLFFLALSLFYRNDFKYKISGIFLLSLFGFNLIYSLSRSAFLGAVIGLIFYFSFKNKKSLVVYLIVIILILLILPIPLKERFSSLYQSFVTGNYEQRIYIWQSAYAMFKENPILGSGIGQFYENYPRYLSPEAPNQTRTFSHAHNIFIQIMAELGLAGLLIFIYLLICIIKVFYNSLPFTNDFKANLGLSFSSAFVGLFVQELFEFSFSGSQIAVLVSIFLGWYLVVIRNKGI